MVKHFIMDYPFQLKYMLEQKGFYLKDGGVHHAFCHGMGTMFVFYFMGFESVAPTLGIIDILIHYHVDYLKAKSNKWFALGPSNKGFWTAMGLDQLAHQLTYVLLVFLALHK